MRPQQEQFWINSFREQILENRISYELNICYLLYIRKLDEDKLNQNQLQFVKDKQTVYQAQILESFPLSPNDQVHAELIHASQ